MIKNRLVGENILIYESTPHKLNPLRKVERILPNPFNDFLKLEANSLEDADDASEMKYIQTHFKLKIEFSERSNSGYIFFTKNFLGDKAYSTEIYLVNAYSFYQWRTLQLIKN